MKKQDPLKRQLDNIRVLIEEAKIRNNFNDEQLAAYPGMSDRTLRDKRADPSSLTFGKLLILLELTGRKIKFVEKEWPPGKASYIPPLVGMLCFMAALGHSFYGKDLRLLKNESPDCPILDCRV